MAEFLAAVGVVAVRVLPPRLRTRVDALRAVTLSAVASGPVVGAGVLTAVAQACRDEERLRFGYTARGSAPTEREVEPHRVVALGGRWYLVAAGTPDAFTGPA
ncbi:helix-turn-helix transcriptional regulator [Streptomyces sp. NPDC014724]|uniref:helix-turn-helix transcriptional regulator n=1 Tax=Streptomyces sp. NPDC014724 TaxID=3364882 RepID=UPI0036FF8B67